MNYEILKKICYIIFNIMGLLVPFFMCIIKKKKYNISFEFIFYSFMMFLIGFLIFSKLFYCISELKLINIFTLTKEELFSFIISGQSFIGGYLGGILLLLLYIKISNSNKNDILSIYTLSLPLMYSIMKIGCYLAGCCEGKYFTNIQLLESIINIICFISIYIFIKNNNKIIKCSLIIFGTYRFIIYFLRNYSTTYNLIIVQIITLFYIFYGIIYNTNDIK